MEDSNSTAAAAVSDVLNASDFYAVLASSSEATTAELRRCYLNTSVRVHPDKNADPQATQAFQRVAEAWSTLSDEAKRKEYDAYLRARRENPQTGTAGAGDAGGYFSDGGAGGMTAEDAFAAFAFATAACASMRSAGVVGDFAQTLFWAEQLVEGRRAFVREDGSLDARAIVTGGFALSAGLRTIGAVAEQAGFKGASKAAERSATVVQCASQAAAVGAVASQIPAVREALSNGAAAASEKAQQLGDAANDAGEALKRASQTGTEQTRAHLGAAIGGVSNWLQRVRTNLAADASAAQPDGAAGGRRCPELPDGLAVTLTGLQGAQHLNGRLGTIVGYDEGTDRYRVELAAPGGLGANLGLLAGVSAVDSADNSQHSGEIKRVRACNLQVIPAGGGYPASSEGHS
eukprot:TRINITY_DN120865_c0_g1_i1.p1 TRINITY_DN120865_c0_g1~~TRINITY_DN120865_c0_g1_i1.p1  ORF type:complete len:404 (-),score=62.41 TRINITY_DN120865_c0_g1_i1:237-1448(-)